MAALLIKDSVNAASDAMGFTEALRHAFHIHELGHAHWAAHNENRYPVGLPPDVEDWRNGEAVEGGPPRHSVVRRQSQVSQQPRGGGDRRCARLRAISSYRRVDFAQRRATGIPASQRLLWQL